MFITMNENFSTESEQHIPKKSMSGPGGVGPGKPLSHIVVQTTSLIIIPNLPHLTFWQLLRREGVQNKARARDFANLIWIQRPLNIELHSHMMHSPNRWLSHKPHQWAIMRRVLTTIWIFHLMWITALRNLLFSQNFKNLYQNCLKIRLTVYNDRIIKTYIEIINI